MKRSLLSLIFIGILGCFQLNAQINSFPYVENFDSETACGVGCGNACVLTGQWTNLLMDDADWAVDANGTGSTNTGPSFDHTTGTTGNYLYIEASGCVSDTAFLESADIDLSSPLLSNMFFDYWYHLYGAQIEDIYVDITNDNGITWTRVDTADANVDLWQLKTINLTSYLGDTIKIRFRGLTGTSFGSDMAIDDISLYTVLSNDAGIISIDNIVNPITPGINNIDVSIKNFGADTLQTANIEWSVDGNLQTPFNWVGSLAKDSVDAAVNIGTYNFPNGLFTLKAWSALPNGVLDSANGNDTSEIILCTPLKGYYTLGGIGADFNTFTDLGDVLSSCGVDSHVVVNVNPGIYVDRLILDHVPGAASTATITIDGANPSLVTLSNSAFSNVYLDGTDWTTIKNMTLENSGVIDAYGVQLRDSAMNNTIDSCVINMSLATGLSDVIGVSASNTETSSFTEGLNAYWTMVSNNMINGGEKAIHFEGANASRNIGNSFMNNTIDSPEDYGFYMDDQDSIKIIGNVITNITNANGDGIYTFDLQTFDISYNSVMDVPDYGIYISDGNYSLDAIPTSRGVFVNNMVSSRSDYGVYFDQVEETDVWHNTVYNTSGTTGAFRVNDMVNLDIRNNIFMSETDYAFESLDDISVGGNVIEYNDYWTNGTLFILDLTAVVDLTTWQTNKPAYNVNSINVDPVFVGGINDLHALSLNANDLGDNTVGILDDIDGETRPAGPNVDMGADEFTPFMFNAAFVDFITPESIICGDSLTPITVVVKNLGDTIFNMSITVDVTGDLIQSLTYNYADTLLFGETDTVMIGTINTYWGVNFNLNGYVILANEQDMSDDTLSYSFTARPFEPKGFDVYACDVDTAWLTGLNLSGVAYNWYDSLVGGTIVGTGDSLLVPSVTTQSTYFLQYANNADSLLTTIAGGNSCGGGAMFDVTATNTSDINGVSVNTTTALAGAMTVTVHYIPNGTYVGNETNALAWTTLGTFNVVSAGTGNLTWVDFGGPTISIPVGATYAMYVEYASSYTNGVFTYSNADLTINTGVGLCGSFSGINNPRSFNGQLHYGTTACSSIRTPVTAILDISATASFTSIANFNVVNFDGSASTQADSLTWDFGDGNTGTGIMPSHTYTVDSTYIVCLSAHSNCNIDVVCDTMDVCDSIGGNFTTIMTGFNAAFTDVSSGTPVSWNWNFGDGNTSTVQNPSHTYLSVDSTYTVTLTVFNYCGDSSIFVSNIVTVDVNELSIGAAITVSPNPSKGQFVINMSNYNSNNVGIVITDQLGKVIYNKSLNKTDQKKQQVIDLSDYSNGIYFLRLSSDTDVATKKIIIQR